MISTPYSPQWAKHAAAFAATASIGASDSMGAKGAAGGDLSRLGGYMLSTTGATVVRGPGPYTFSACFGRRQLTFSYDTKVRRYAVKPWFECTAGAARGHLEILMFRRWLLVFSKAPATV